MSTTRKQGSFRDKSTDDAIIQLVAEAGGEMQRRDLSRRLMRRADFGAALRRLIRLGKIEVVDTRRGSWLRQPIQYIRLIGHTAMLHGKGFIKIGATQETVDDDQENSQ